MTYFADLTTYTYLDPVRHGLPLEPPALNVGWLDGSHSFPKGDVPPGFSGRLLEELIAQRFHVTRGYHDCDLCPRRPSRPPETISVEGEPYALGDREVLVVGTTGIRYDAPSTICHYIAAHSYRPPNEFVDAVLGLPSEPALPEPGGPFHVGEHVVFFPAEVGPASMWLSWDEGVVDDIRPEAQSFGFHFVSDPEVRHAQGFENVVRKTVYYRRWRRVFTEALSRTGSEEAAFEEARPVWLRVLAEHPMHGSSGVRRHPALPKA